MVMHRQYARYVLRHKLFVFLAGLWLHVPLHQLIVHDWSKFLPDEWLAYARYFYGEGSAERRQPREAKWAFDHAWLRHQHRSPHHWQHWVLRNDDGSTVALPMPERFAREMVADWRGAGRALGMPDTAAWFRRNRGKILLHQNTEALVCRLLGIEQHTILDDRRDHAAYDRSAYGDTWRQADADAARAMGRSTAGGWVDERTRRAMRDAPPMPGTTDRAER
jgi:hypothetical protein